jgi:WD40 repeat protein
MSDRSGLIVPVVLWGGKCSQNRITHVCCIRNGGVIITGTTDGYVVQWSVDETLGWIQPELTLIGHETPISCVAPASTSTSSTRYVTCSEDGQMCLWDSVDGRAVESVRHQYVHRKVIPHRLRISSHHYQTRLLCVGDYAEILVVDGQDLNVLFNLSSRVEPDWINALTVVQSEKHDVVIGVSRSSMIKLWSLADLDKKDATSIVFEDESKVLNARNVQSIACSKQNTRMMLVISPTTWQVIDPSNLNQLVVSECAIEAISGAIIDVDRIAVGFADATIVLFQLPRSKLSGKQVVDRFGESPSNVGNVEQPFVFALLRGVPVSPASVGFPYRKVNTIF